MKHHTRSYLRALAALTLTSPFVYTGNAATATWNNGTGTAGTTADLNGTTWTNGTTAATNYTPVTTDSWIFGATTGATTLNNNLTNGASPFSVAAINFNAGGSAYTIGGNAITLTGDINYSVNTTLNFDIVTSAVRTVIGANGTTLVLGGNISGTGGLTKSGGSSSSLTLSGTNTYTGVTTASTGTLLTTQAAALAGFATTGKVVFGGGTLGVRVGGAGWTTAEVDTLLANANKASGALGIDTTNGNLSQWTAFTTVNFGPLLGLTKLGANTFTLTGTNTYTGATTVSAGTLKAGAANAFSAASALTLANINGASLDLNNFNTTLFSLAGGGTTGGNVSLGSAALTLAGNANTTYAGVISGTGSLNKTGFGNSLLTGTNTYTGATNVSAGAIGGTGRLASAVTLSGTGGINLANGAIGTFTLGSTLALTGAAGAHRLSFDLGNATATTDKLVVTSGAPAVTNDRAAVIGFNQIGQSAGGRVTAGTYTLIQGAAAPTLSSFTLATTAAFGSTFSLGVTGNNLQVTTTQASAGPAAAFWTGAGGNNWSTAGNWNTDATSSVGTGAAPSYQSNVTFATTTPAATNLTTNTIDTDRDINSLTFASTSGGVTIGGTKMLTLEATAANGNTAGNGITASNTSGTNTISANIGLASTQTWTVASGGTLAVSGAITDFGSGFSLTKAGTGTLTLGGANTYTGNTSVAAGTLAVTGTGSITSTGGLSLGFTSNSTFQYDSSATSTFGGAIFAGSNNASDTINQTAGQINTTGLTLNTGLGRNGTYNLSGGTLAVSGAVNVGQRNATSLISLTGGNLTVTGALNVVNGGTGGATTGTVTQSGTSTATVGSLLLTTTNNTAQTYINTATYNLNGGTLTTGSIGAVNAGTLGTGGANTSTFNFAGGTLRASSSTTTFMQGLTTANVKAGGAIIDTNGFDITIAQNLVKATGATTEILTKNGTGTLTLSGSNTYTGLTTISAGSLIAGSANAFNLATGQVNVSGGTLDSSVAAANFGGAINLSSGAVNINTNSAAGTLTLASGKHFTASGGTLTFNLGSAFDQIISLGGAATVTLTGSTLALDTTGAGFNYGSSYQLFSNFTSVAGTALITGYDTAGYTAALSNTGLLAFTAIPSSVPEPATYAALAGLGILGFAVYRRRTVG